MIVSKDRILLNDYQHSAFPSGADRHEYQLTVQPTNQPTDRPTNQKTIGFIGNKARESSGHSLLN